MSTSQPAPVDSPDQLQQNVRSAAGWLIFSGVLSVILGMLCIGSPLVSGIAINLLLGGMVLFAGLLELVQGFRLSKGTTGRGWTIFAGILAMVVGGYMLARPVGGLLALTWVLALYFLLSGILRCLAAFELRPTKGWGWVLFSGLVTVALAVMLYSDWPLSGAWAIGTLFGVHVLFNGWDKIMIGLAGRAATS